MARNPAAQTAFGPMVLAAVEQNEPPARGETMRRLMIRGSEFTGPGLWVNMACRKRFIDDKLKEARDDIDAVVILGAGWDTRAYLLTRQVRMPVFEVDLPVNIALKAKTVRRVLGEPPLSV